MGRKRKDPVLAASRGSEPFASNGDDTTFDAKEIEKTIFSKDAPFKMFDLAQSLAKKFKGVDGIATIIHDAYNATGTNPKERAVIMSILFRVFQAAHVDQTLDLEDAPMEDMQVLLKSTLDDMGAENQLLKEFQARVKALEKELEALAKAKPSTPKWVRVNEGGGI